MYAQGYEVAMGDGYIRPGTGKRASWSLHRKKLANDLDLFYKGKYLRTTKAHRKFGEFWEHLGGAWGGRFKKPDGNHYSTEHRGVK